MAERPGQLAQVALRLVLFDPVTLRHGPPRHVKGPEQCVDQGELAGEVGVVRLWCPGVVPVVELGRGEDPARRAEGQAHVGVDAVGWYWEGGTSGSTSEICDAINGERKS